MSDGASCGVCGQAENVEGQERLLATMKKLDERDQELIAALGRAEEAEEKLAQQKVGQSRDVILAPPKADEPCALVRQLLVKNRDERCQEWEAKSQEWEVSHLSSMAHPLHPQDRAFRHTSQGGQILWMSRCLKSLSVSRVGCGGRRNASAWARRCGRWSARTRCRLVSPWCQGRSCPG
jgi:hypothetical protein